jgi:tRNA 2-(methylsulfanyl)-N6-isopentenyladenosine37 hydroxylase
VSAAVKNADLDHVLAFLPCATPAVWFQQACEHLDILLVDHAHCEKKAASTALGMLYRYVDRPELLHRLSRLAREELRHFEQVHDLMRQRGVVYRHLSASRYAGRLMALVGQDEPHRLVDTLLVGAIVEARSCERFAGLVAVLPEDLAALYGGLLASEARHYRHYLELAGRYADEPLEGRVQQFLQVERDLVTLPDTVFRFHSGPLAEAASDQACASGKQISEKSPSRSSMRQPHRSHAPST